MRACSCANTLNNTGQTDCQPLMEVAKRIVIVPLYTSLGVRNKLTIATLFTPAVLTALINQADKTLRWYPTPDMENIGGERAESIFEEAPSGRRAFVKQGARTMSFEIWEQGAEYKYQLDAARCTEFGIYVIDASGSIFGMVPATEDGFLYPIKIDKSSWDVRLVLPTETTTGKLAVSFNWNNSEDDALLRTIAGSDTTASTELLAMEGLLDISVVYGTITTLTVKVSLFERFGSRYKKNKLKGLVITDFISSVTGVASKLRNITDAADITISTVVEETGAETASSGPGTYLITFTPAQTSADVMAVKVLKTGFDFADTVANTFVIP